MSIASQLIAVFHYMSTKRQTSDANGSLSRAGKIGKYVTSPRGSTAACFCFVKEAGLAYHVSESMATTVRSLKRLWMVQFTRKFFNSTNWYANNFWQDFQIIGIRLPIFSLPYIFLTCAGAGDPKRKVLLYLSLQQPPCSCELVGIRCILYNNHFGIITFTTVCLHNSIACFSSSYSKIILETWLPIRVSSTGGSFPPIPSSFPSKGINCIITS